MVNSIDIENVKKLLDNDMLSDEIKSSLKAVLDNKENDNTDFFAEQNLKAIKEYIKAPKNTLKLYLNDQQNLYEIYFQDDIPNKKISILNMAIIDNNNVSNKTLLSRQETDNIIRTSGHNLSLVPNNKYIENDNSIVYIKDMMMTLLTSSKKTKEEVLSKILLLNCKSIANNEKKFYFYGEFGFGNPVILRRYIHYNKSGLVRQAIFDANVTSTPLEKMIYDDFGYSCVPRYISNKTLNINNFMLELILRNN